MQHLSRCLISLTLVLVAPFAHADAPFRFTDTPGQLSLAVTDPGFGCGTCDAHCTVIVCGHVIVGGWLSFTVTVKLQVA